MADFLTSFQTDKKSQDLDENIFHHLAVLLNTRRGCLSHMPEYGLPDYGTCPDHRTAKQFYIDQIQALVKRFEPRIKRLLIEEIEDSKGEYVLALSLRALTDHPQTLRFHSYLLNQGHMVLEPQ